jgi:hypothetical protein
MVRRSALALGTAVGVVVAIAPPAYAADTTPPTIVGSISPAPNGAGWNDGAVTVHFTCSDADSGIASCTPDQVVSQDGTTVIAGQAVDNDGNTATATVTVKIDSVGPIVQLTTNPPATGNFSNGPVTVHATCGDALSGVAVCPADQVVTAEGSTVVNKVATDNAGNDTNASVTVKIDTVGPTIVPTLNGTAGDNGYYRSAVTISYACSDAGSGVRSCPSTKTVTNEGVYTIPATAVDNVGHDTTVQIPLKIDRTLPKGKINSPFNGRLTPGGTLSGSASDGLSGVKTVTVAYDTGPAAAVALVCQSANRVCTWSVAGPSTLGARTARVTVTDFAGNVFVSALTRFTVAN